MKSAVNYLWIQSPWVDVSGRITFREPMRNERAREKNKLFHSFPLQKCSVTLFSWRFFLSQFFLCVAAAVVVAYFQALLILSMKFLCHLKNFSVWNKKHRIEVGAGIKGSIYTFSFCVKGLAASHYTLYHLIWYIFIEHLMSISP